MADNKKGSLADKINFGGRSKKKKKKKGKKKIKSIAERLGL